MEAMGPLSFLAPHHQADHLLFAGMDGKIGEWSRWSDSEPVVFRSELNVTHSAAYLPDGNTALVAGKASSEVWGGDQGLLPS
jgi:hypothetical protein